MSTVRRTACCARGSRRVRAAALVQRSGGALDHRRVLGALVAVLVLGILGMHALPGHGLPTGAGSSSGMTSMVGTEGRMAGVDAAGQPREVSRTPADQTDRGDVRSGTARARLVDQPPTHDPGSGHGPDDGTSMLTLCAFILTVALTLLVSVFVGIRGVPLPAAFWPAGPRDTTPGWARATGPPHVWRFSVIRC